MGGWSLVAVAATRTLKIFAQLGSREGNLRNSAVTSDGSPRTSKQAWEDFAGASTRAGVTPPSAAWAMLPTEAATEHNHQGPAKAKTRNNARRIDIARCADAYGKGRVRKSALPSCSISTMAFASSS